MKHAVDESEVRCTWVRSTIPPPRYRLPPGGKLVSISIARKSFLCNAEGDYCFFAAETGPSIVLRMILPSTVSAISSGTEGADLGGEFSAVSVIFLMPLPC